VRVAAILWELPPDRNPGGILAVLACGGADRYSPARDDRSRLPGAILVWRFAEEDGV